MTDNTPKIRFWTVIQEREDIQPGTLNQDAIYKLECLEQL